MFSFSNGYSQEEDSTIVYKDLHEIVVYKYSKNQYDREKERVKKIYPMALKAKAIMDEYEAEIAHIDNKREARKYSKKMTKYLKEEFTYSIRDLYTSEGRLLMQLIHRETGMTVDEIITMYSGKAQAFAYRNMAKLFDQDLKDKYDPEKKNYYTEIVITDILIGTIEFNPEMDKMTKEAFKISQKEYRQGIKDSRQKSKERKKINKETEKAKKKSEKNKK